MVDNMKIPKKECCSIAGKGEAVDLQHWAVKLMTSLFLCACFFGTARPLESHTIMYKGISVSYLATKPDQRQVRVARLSSNNKMRNK